MPISRFNKTDLLGGAIMDFLAKAGSGLSTGYGQAKDTEKFNDAFGTIQHRQTQVGQQPFSMPNMGPLAQLLQTQNGPGTIDLMKLLQGETPADFTLTPGATRHEGGTGREIASAPFAPPKETPFNPEEVVRTLMSPEGKPTDYRIQFGPDNKELGRSELGSPFIRPSSYAMPALQKRGILERFNRDPEAQRFQQVLSQSNTAEDVLSMKNPIGDQAIQVFMAKATGEVGNLNLTEQERYGGSKAILAKLEQTLETMKSGTLTPENRQFLTDLAGSMRNSALGNYEKFARFRARQYSLTDPSLSEEELFRMFQYETPGDSQTDGLPTDAEIDAMTEEEFNEYEKRTGGQ